MFPVLFVVIFSWSVVVSLDFGILGDVGVLVHVRLACLIDFSEGRAELHGVFFEGLEYVSDDPLFGLKADFLLGGGVGDFAFRGISFVWENWESRYRDEVLFAYDSEHYEMD